MSYRAGLFALAVMLATSIVCAAAAFVTGQVYFGIVFTIGGVASGVAIWATYEHMVNKMKEELFDEQE